MAYRMYYKSNQHSNKYAAVRWSNVGVTTIDLRNSLRYLIRGICRRRNFTVVEDSCRTLQSVIDDLQSRVPQPAGRLEFGKEHPRDRTDSLLYFPVGTGSIRATMAYLNFKCCHGRRHRPALEFTSIIAL